MAHRCAGWNVGELGKGVGEEEGGSDRGGWFIGVSIGLRSLIFT